MEYISVIKTSELMLDRGIIAVCFEIYTEHLNTVCGLNVGYIWLILVVHIATTGLRRFSLLIS